MSGGMGYFLCGTLCHPPLLSVVLGRVPALVPATLPGHSLRWVRDQPFAMLVAGGDGAVGLLAQDLSDDEITRLGFYESAFGNAAGALWVTLAGGQQMRAQVWLPDADFWRADGPWDLPAWRATWAATVVATAQDIMAGDPQVPPPDMRRRSAQMLTRGGARVRAQALRAGTESLRRTPRDGDIECASLSHPYSAYFAVEERDLRYRRYDGTMSALVNRAAFISGDAAILLPYDPVRDRVLLIEQFRVGPHARGDANPWLLETIAGRIDGGETPEGAARREAREEAGLDLADLIEGPRYYPSPAAKAEYLYSFVGIADLPDTAAGLGGLQTEAEDIRSHVVSFERLMALVASGEVDNAPLLILAYWLAAERPRLRAAAGA